MKKLLICALMVGFLTAPLPAKAAFEGEIAFKVDFTGGDVKAKAQIAMMMPNSYDLLVRGNQLKVNMHGGMMGMMMGEIIVDGESGRAYAVSDMQETAYEMLPDLSLKGLAEPEIEDEGETAQIAGYTCKKYKVTQMKPGGPVVQYMWMTDAIQLGNLESFKGPLKDSIPFLIDGLKGFPLKIITTLPGVDMVMTLSATAVKQRPLDPSEFAVPAGYKIKPYDPAAMFGN